MSRHGGSTSEMFRRGQTARGEIYAQCTAILREKNIVPGALVRAYGFLYRVIRQTSDGFVSIRPEKDPDAEAFPAHPADLTLVQ